LFRIYANNFIPCGAAAFREFLCELENQNYFRYYSRLGPFTKLAGQLTRRGNVGEGAASPFGTFRQLY
jgi:hypothetical protein